MSFASGRVPNETNQLYGDAKGTRHGAVLSFGPFRLMPSLGLLFEGDRPVQLGSRALKILQILAERAGELVEKEELTRLVWPLCCGRLAWRGRQARRVGSFAPLRRWRCPTSASTGGWRLVTCWKERWTTSLKDTIQEMSKLPGNFSPISEGSGLIKPAPRRPRLQ